MDIAVYCLNVGQGSCAAIVDRSPAGRRGNYQAVLLDVGVDGRRLADWLRGIGVGYLPLIAVSHNDADHILGLHELVTAYRKRIGELLFVVDRPPALIPFWLDAQQWAAKGIVARTAQLDTPKAAIPGMGRVLIEPPKVGYRLHCIYPDVFQNYAAVQNAPKFDAATGHGPNATSALLALARGAMPKRTRILFGGDLDFYGWRCLAESGHRLSADVLVAPHHGAPRGASAAFGPNELAQAVEPHFVVISAGTRQKHVRANNEGTARHPLPEVVQAFRRRNASVLCTQLTRRCVDIPDAISNNSVLPLAPSIPPIDLAFSGTACAGTVVTVVNTSGHLSVMRANDHQRAVDALLPAEHPICRP